VIIRKITFEFSVTAHANLLVGVAFLIAARSLILKVSAGSQFETENRDANDT
jgi:hypothetical protein